MCYRGFGLSQQGGASIASFPDAQSLLHHVLNLVFRASFWRLYHKEQGNILAEVKVKGVP